MKIMKPVFLLLLLLTSTSFAQQTPKMDETTIETIKNLAIQAIQMKLSCTDCQKVEDVLNVDMTLFFTYWKPILTGICDYVGQHFKMSAGQCMGVVNRFVPSVKASHWRLALGSRGTFICSYMLGVCPLKYMEKISIDPIIEQIYKGMPAEKLVQPTRKSTFTILQMSDPHIDLEYTAGSSENCVNSILCCRANSTPLNTSDPGSAGYWGSHTYSGSCDLPIQTFRSFVSFASKTFSPDYLVWLGDNPHHEIDQVTQEYNFQITKTIADELKAGFPSTEIHFAIGNHEHFPVDTLDITKENKDKARDWFFANFTSAYKNLLTETEFLEFKEKGFYTRYSKKHNIRWINLLSIPYDENNMYLLVHEYDPDGMVRMLWSALQKAEDNNEIVYINVHIPPSAGDYGLFTELFNDLTDRYKNNIRAIFSGHTHTDMLKWTKSRYDASKIAVTDFVAPSLTTFGGKYPAFRVYEVDTDTGVLLEMKQYKLDLDKWNKVGSSADPTWDLVYSFTQDFALKDMNRDSLQQLYDNLMAVKQPYMQNYLDHLSNTSPNTLKLDKGHRADDDYLEMRCGFNTRVKDYAKCLGYKLFTKAYSGSLQTVVISSMFQHYMQFIN